METFQEKYASKKYLWSSISFLKYEWAPRALLTVLTSECNITIWKISCGSLFQESIFFIEYFWERCTWFSHTTRKESHWRFHFRFSSHTLCVVYCWEFFTILFFFKHSFFVLIIFFNWIVNLWLNGNAMNPLKSIAFFNPIGWIFSQFLSCKSKRTWKMLLNLQPLQVQRYFYL